MAEPMFGAVGTSVFKALITDIPKHFKHSQQLKHLECNHTDIRTLRVVIPEHKCFKYRCTLSTQTLLIVSKVLQTLAVLSSCAVSLVSLACKKTADVSQPAGLLKTRETNEHLARNQKKGTFVRSNASTLHNSHYHHQYQVLSIRTMLMYKWALDGTQTSLVQDLLAHDVKTVPSVAYK